MCLKIIRRSESICLRECQWRKERTTWTTYLFFNRLLKRNIVEIFNYSYQFPRCRHRMPNWPERLQTAKQVFRNASLRKNKNKSKLSYLACCWHSGSVLTERELILKLQWSSEVLNYAPLLPPFCTPIRLRSDKKIVFATIVQLLLLLIFPSRASR